MADFKSWLLHWIRCLDRMAWWNIGTALLMALRDDARPRLLRYWGCRLEECVVTLRWMKHRRRRRSERWWPQDTHWLPVYVVHEIRRNQRNECSIGGSHTHVTRILHRNPSAASISRYFIRFLEKDSSRKLIFFLIFGRRFLEKDDFQQDPLLFETVPLPPVRKWQTDLPETRKCAVSQTKTFNNSDCGLRIH